MQVLALAAHPSNRWLFATSAESSDSKHAMVELWDERNAAQPLEVRRWLVLSV